MKRKYVKPMFVAEQFAANEYVATCVVGRCDISSINIHEWIDDGDLIYESGEEGAAFDSNEACGNEQVVSHSGTLKECVPVVCFDATLKTKANPNGEYYQSITGYRYKTLEWFIFPYVDTHVSSVKPTQTNAS